MASPFRLVAQNIETNYCYLGSFYLIFTDSPNDLFLLLGILLIFLCFLFIIKYLKLLFSSFFKELLIVVLLTTLSFMAPTFQYLLMLLFSSIVFILCFPYLDTYIPARRHVALLVFELLNQINLLSYLEYIYFKFFGQEQKPFFVQTIFIYIFCFIYVLISKYLFLNQSSKDLSTLIPLYLLLFICTMMVYLRILLTTSIITHNLSYSFLKTEELPNDPSPFQSEKNPISNKPTNASYSLFTFRKTINNNQYNHTAINASRYRFIGLGVGFCTLGVGGYTAYQQHLQTRAAQEALRVAQDSVHAQDIKNHEMARQNDLEEVSQGFMSKEDYQSKYNKK